VREKASDWLDSAAEHLPSMPRRRRFARPTDVSAATAGLTGAGALLIGIGAMWLFDPQRGRGRRAWIGQKTTRVLNETGRFMRATGRHLANKSKGYYRETSKLASSASSSMAGGALGSGGQARSTGDISSAHNQLTPTPVAAVTYGVAVTTESPNCPPGAVGSPDAGV
jgi:hypothetical protein